MLKLAPIDFFTLTNFAHAKIFENCRYVWEALQHLSKYLAHEKLGKIEVEIPPGVTLINPSQISIGAGTLLEAGAFIQGPCIIGANCSIRHGAYIRGDVLIGDESVVGHGTEIKHSILLPRAAAPHFNYVGDSILGSDTNLGAGAICANLRFDHKPVKVYCADQKIDTGLIKFGAIIGDGAQVGCNCVLNPGTLLGPHSSCFPCLNIEGYIPPHQIVKPPTKS